MFVGHYQSSRNGWWYLGKIVRKKQSSYLVVHGDEIVAGAMVSRKARGIRSMRRAFKVTVHTSVGLVVASVISADGGWETFWAAKVCAGVSMLRCVVELDVR